jgi:hypothetical protein
MKRPPDIKHVLCVFCGSMKPEFEKIGKKRICKDC